MHVVLTLAPGGTERLVIDLARLLAPQVDSVVCCLDEPGDWAQELTSEGVPVVALRRKAGFHPALGNRIARLAEEHGTDVLHCHHYSPFVYGQIAGLLHRTSRVVFTEHGRLSDAGPSLKRRLVNPLLGRLPAAIFAVSADLREHMLAEGLPGHRLGVIHNGINPGSRPSIATRLAARESLGLSPEAMVIATAGRLDPVKDFPTLFDAFAGVKRTWPAARLVVIGDGPERSQLEQQAMRLGVAAAVSFTGYRNDVRSLLAGADVYVNSSIHEGVSLTILEAMAAALPVVATRVGGTPEVVLDHETGVLVPARSPAALASAIEGLFRSPGQRRVMGEAARFRVKNHFSVDAMVTSYLNAYRASLNS
jgi:glycosyltransferase involved in cell wall biosynthesis